MEILYKIGIRIFGNGYIIPIGILTGLLLLFFIMVIKRNNDINNLQTYLTKIDRKLIFILMLNFITIASFSMNNNLDVGNMPKSYYQHKSSGEEIIIELISDTKFNSIYMDFESLSQSENYYNIYGSYDQSEWFLVSEINHLGNSEEFGNQVVSGYEWQFNYLKIVNSDQDIKLYEFGVDSINGLIDYNIMNDESKYLSINDEQNLLKSKINSNNNMIINSNLNNDFLSLSTFLKYFYDSAIVNQYINSFVFILISALIIPIFFNILKIKFKNTILACLGTLVFSCNFIFLTLSVMGNELIITMLLFLSSILLLLKYIVSNQDNKYLYIFSLLFAITCMADITLLPFLLIFMLILYKNKNNFCNNKVYIKSILLFIIPVLAYYLISNAFDFHMINNSIKVFYMFQESSTANFDFSSNLFEFLFGLKPIFYNFSKYTYIINTISIINNPIEVLFYTSSTFFVIYWTFKSSKKYAFDLLILLFTILIIFATNKHYYLYNYIFLLPILIIILLNGVNILIKLNCKYKKSILIYLIIFYLTFLAFLPVTTGLSTTNSFIQEFCRIFESWYLG